MTTQDYNYSFQPLLNTQTGNFEFRIEQKRIKKYWFSKAKIEAKVTIFERIETHHLLYVMNIIEELATDFYHKHLSHIKPENITWIHFNEFQNTETPLSVKNLSWVEFKFNDKAQKFEKPVWHHWIDFKGGLT